jgi:hypothetical protein
MQRLAVLVPRPRLHLIRFHGVLAPDLLPARIETGPDWEDVVRQHGVALADVFDEDRLLPGCRRPGFGREAFVHADGLEFVLRLGLGHAFAQGVGVGDAVVL